MRSEAIPVEKMIVFSSAVPGLLNSYPVYASIEILEHPAGCKVGLFF